MLLIPALGRQRQEDPCEFEASLVCRESSRTARATLRNPVSVGRGKREEEERKGEKERGEWTRRERGRNGPWNGKRGKSGTKAKAER